MRPTSAALPTAVYQLFDARNRLMYVGCSNDPESRLYNDHCRKTWGPWIARMEVDYFDDRAAALERERQLISELEPPHNRNHTRRAVRPIVINKRLPDGQSPEDHIREVMDRVNDRILAASFSRRSA